MHPQTETLLQEATNHDLSRIIDRYQEQHDLPTEVVHAHFTELKKYLLLCALNPDKRYPMTDPIDEAWHTFILFTREYTAFCNQIAGRYIHHNPRILTTELTDEDIQEDKTKFKMFREDYISTFNENPPLEFWPYLTDVDSNSTCHANNCSRCKGNQCD